MWASKWIGRKDSDVKQAKKRNMQRSKLYSVFCASRSLVPVLEHESGEVKLNSFFAISNSVNSVTDKDEALRGSTAKSFGSCVVSRRFTFHFVQMNKKQPNRLTSHLKNLHKVKIGGSGFFIPLTPSQE